MGQRGGRVGAGAYTRGRWAQPVPPLDTSKGEDIGRGGLCSQCSGESKEHQDQGQWLKHADSLQRSEEVISQGWLGVARAALTQQLGWPSTAALCPMGRLLCHPPTLAPTRAWPLRACLARFIYLEEKGQQGELMASRAPVPCTRCPALSLQRETPQLHRDPAAG